MRLIRTTVVLVCVALGTSWARSDIKLPALFCGNMVLQRDMKVPVWGWAEPGEKIALTLDKFKAEAVADKDGKWTAKLGPMKAGGPFEMTVAGKNTITLKNVLIGEVWLCTGQSNMEFYLKSSANGEQEAAKADYPEIRLFTVGRNQVLEPAGDCKGSWAPCKPPLAWGFSAVGYYFGKELYKAEKVPVGLINTCFGGTPVEAWMSRKVQEADPDLKVAVTDWDKKVADYPAQKEKFAQDLAKWSADSDRAKAEGKPVPAKPTLIDPTTYQHRPGVMYNGMIAPVAPFGIRGVIWYQGENNAGRAYSYRKSFPTLIANWRALWGQGDFPFLFVQIPNFQAAKPDPTESMWAELREAQLMTLSVRNTAMAVTIDIGDAKNIHPTDKEDVGKRLVLAARQLVFGEKVEGMGPIYDGMKVEGDKIRLTFKHVGSGLEAKGGELKQFAIAGADKKFVWAQAKIEKNTVVVSSPDVKAPVSVRYAWADNPEGCNLCNKDGLFASPFRTDDWPGVTPRK